MCEDRPVEIKSFNWIVSQVTAREHYAVPRAFHSRDHLHTFYTDVWCRHGASMLRNGPARIRAFAGRFHRDLPSHKVVSFTVRTLLDAAVCAGQKHPNTIESKYQEFIRVGKKFSQQVNRHLRRQPLNAETALFFGFDTGCLETLEMLRERGVTAVVDQIDPGRVEEDIVFLESEKWQGWQKTPGRIPDAYYERLGAEWQTASLVLVNSKWSKAALVTQGVPAEKIIVVPLAYEPYGGNGATRRPHENPLIVLWLGSVILRKGIQYLIEAAKLLKHSNMRFIIAGEIGISKEALASAPANMSFIGRVTRDRTAELFEHADVFVLPTLSDGFGITQLEAMAHGVPVIATPNCGEVVTDGVDGLLVPAGNGRALAEAIARIDADRRFLEEMSREATAKSRLFSLRRYCEQVEAEVTRYISTAATTAKQ